jgi:hypothetical protein
MRLEDISAEVRPRGRWEAVDLGFAMVRRHFGRLLLAWLLCVGPIWALILWGGASGLGYGWAILILWWWKPLYDRLPLFILSRALFGAVPTIGQTLRAWPKLLLPNLGHSLIFGRISGTRTLMLPVLMLEGLKGADRKARSQVLIRHSGGCAGSLTFVCALYEGILTFALAALALMFVPEEGSFEWLELAIEAGFTRGIPPSLLWLALGSWLAAVTLIELFYVGGGFGLYLNARTHLEGWDVELAFRRLGRRLAGVAAACLLVLGVVGVQAQDELELPQEKAKARKEIETILADDAFKVKKVESYKRKANFGGDFAGGGGQFFQYVAYAVFWAAVAVALYFLGRFIYRYWHTLRGQQLPGRAEPPKPARTIAGMDVTPESLPDDIVAAARAAWERGDERGALSLLYRGALSWLIHRLELPIRDSDTEGDCLRRAAAITESRPRDYFTRLTGVWVSAAYAERAAGPEAMQTLLQEWPYHRGKGAAQ